MSRRLLLVVWSLSVQARVGWPILTWLVPPAHTAQPLYSAQSQGETLQWSCAEYSAGKWCTQYKCTSNLKKISDDWGLMVGIKRKLHARTYFRVCINDILRFIFSHAVYTRLTRQVGSPVTSTHLSCQIFGGGNSGPADPGNADISTQNR